MVMECFDRNDLTYGGLLHIFIAIDGTAERASKKYAPTQATMKLLAILNRQSFQVKSKKKMKTTC